MVVASHCYSPCDDVSSVPTVSVPAAVSVAEDGGSVMVCATLSGVPGTTGRDFNVMLATSDGTGS